MISRDIFWNLRVCDLLQGDIFLSRFRESIMTRSYSGPLLKSSVAYFSSEDRLAANDGIADHQLSYSLPAACNADALRLVKRDVPCRPILRDGRGLLLLAVANFGLDVQLGGRRIISDPVEIARIQLRGEQGPRSGRGDGVVLRALLADIIRMLDAEAQSLRWPIV